MGAQEHTSLCGSKALLSTCSLLRGPKREQQAPNHWDLHKKGHRWMSLISKPGHDEWQMGTRNLQGKEVMVCERCVVYLQTHCVLSYETVSPLPNTCSVCCSGHPSELQSGTRIAEPQQWTCRNGSCPTGRFKAGPGTDTALQSRGRMVLVMEPPGNSERCLPAVVTVDTWGFAEALITVCAK